MSPNGPTLPTWAIQQVGGYQGYTGRDANGVATAALAEWAWGISPRAVPDVIVSPYPARAAMGECRRRACPAGKALHILNSRCAKATAAGFAIFEANAEMPPTTESNRNSRDQPGHCGLIGLRSASVQRLDLDDRGAVIAADSEHGFLFIFLY